MMAGWHTPSSLPTIWAAVSLTSMLKMAHLDPPCCIHRRTSSFSCCGNGCRSRSGSAFALPWSLGASEPLYCRLLDGALCLAVSTIDWDPRRLVSSYNCHIRRHLGSCKVRAWQYSWPAKASTLDAGLVPRRSLRRQLMHLSLLDAHELWWRVLSSFGKMSDCLDKTSWLWSRSWARGGRW